MIINSFIIRVYEQPLASEIENNAVKLKGIVEDVDTGIKHAFHNKNELWQFMTKQKEQVADQPVKSDLIK